MKRFICTVLTLVLVLSLFAPASFATKNDYDKIVAEVAKTNLKIEQLILKAQNDAKKEIEKANEEDRYIEDVKGNKELLISLNQQKLDKKIDSIIKNLIKDTDGLSENMIKKAKAAGVKVICEYVEVDIGNRKVLIDPLRVVGF